MLGVRRPTISSMFSAALLGLLATGLQARPVLGQVAILDTFEDDTVGQAPNGPEVGNYASWGTSGHTVVDIGGDKWCQSPIQAGLIAWEPAGAPSGALRLQYTFQIATGAILFGANAVSNSVTMERAGLPGLTITLQWGNDHKLRLDGVEVASYQVATEYIVVWDINTTTDTFDLAINGQPLVSGGTFSSDVASLRDLSIGGNFSSSGSFLTDDVSAIEGGLFDDGFESGDTTHWSSGGPPVTAGNECSDPLPLTVGALSSGDLADNTGSTGDDTSCGSGDTIDEWMVVTATCTGTLSATTCRPGTVFDTVLAAHDVCGGAEITCNDDAPGPVTPECSLGADNRKSSIAFAATVGATYLIRVSAYQDSFPNPTDTQYEIQTTCTP